MIGAEGDCIELTPSAAAALRLVRPKLRNAPVETEVGQTRLPTLTIAGVSIVNAGRLTHVPLSIASDALKLASNNVAPQHNDCHLALAGHVAGWRPTKMRMFETVASTMLVIAAQALVVGVVVSTL